MQEILYRWSMQNYVKITGGMSAMSESILPVQPIETSYTFDGTPLCPLGYQNLDVKNKTTVNIRPFGCRRAAY